MHLWCLEVNGFSLELWAIYQDVIITSLRNEMLVLILLPLSSFHLG